jgi:hypothetical protein
MRDWWDDTKREPRRRIMTTAMSEAVETINLTKEIVIEAPAEVVFESMLEELGPGSQMPDGTPFPMKLEARPGGRLYRDLGKDTGHFWAHVQVIKPPPHPQPLLELCGPLFMSYPAVNFVQYRLVPEGKATRLKLTHRAMGLIPREQAEGVQEGWEHGLKRIREIAEGKKKR